MSDATIYNWLKQEKVDRGEIEVARPPEIGQPCSPAFFPSESKLTAA